MRASTFTSRIARSSSTFPEGFFTKKRSSISPLFSHCLTSLKAAADSDGLMVVQLTSSKMPTISFENIRKGAPLGLFVKDYYSFYSSEIMNTSVTQFEQKVYGATRRIPVGKVSTYALIASVIGRRFSQRAVGNALNKSPHLVSGHVRTARGKRCLFCNKYFKKEKCPLRCGDKNSFSSVPCHRVVRSDGFVGGYAHGEKVKIKLLRKEGVKIQGNRIDPVIQLWPSRRSGILYRSKQV